MYKTLSVIMTCLLAMIAFACAGGPAGNSANSANNSNAGITNLDKNNMPPGLSTSPLPVNGTTPGIPDPSQVNINMKNPGGTPTPGIPDPANVNKVPKGGTPTPGIPSEAEIRKMMNQGKQQTVRMEANTPPAGNIQQRENMKQMQQRKKPQ
jgi:hypothetical protein